MGKPGPALSFYLSHGADVAALVELESRPEGVAEGDWTKFQRVVRLAKEEVAELLLGCREAIVRGLGDAVVPIDEASRKRVAEEWDAWCEFKPAGRGKKPSFGWFGAYLYVRDDAGGWLGGYVRPRSTDTRLRRALGGDHPPGAQRGDFTPATAVVFHTSITANADLVEAVNACGEQFAAARGKLKAYFADPATGTL